MKKKFWKRFLAAILTVTCMGQSSVFAEQLSTTEQLLATEKLLTTEELVVQEQTVEVANPYDDPLEDDPLAFRVTEVDTNGNLNQRYGEGYVHNSRYDGATVRNGIDVSYYQGNIDWKTVKNAGIEYAFIRVGYRGYQYGKLSEDTKYLQNLQGAINAGLKVGVYIFSQAITEAEAVEEANFLLSRIVGYNISLPVVIDYEYVAEGVGRLSQAGLSKKAGTAVCSAFSNTIKNAGYTPMIYANKSMLQNGIDGEWLGANYKIWLAEYRSKASYTGPYSFWQYSSFGYVNGIEGSVDMNFWYDDSSITSSTVTVENASKFVSRLYENALDRTAAQSELDYWVQKLRTGMTGAEVANGFLFSKEFTNKNLSDSECVERFYLSLMGRTSDVAGKSNWVQYLANGMSRKYVFKQFIDSTEFSNLCASYDIQKGQVVLTEARDKNYNTTSFLARNYTQFLGRAYDIAGLNYWCQKIYDQGYSLQWVAYGFVFSPECINKNLSNEEFVKMLYRGCFDREGKASEVEYWTKHLDEGTKNKEEVFWGFANSQEFSFEII